jgi:hypothetical protein
MKTFETSINKHVRIYLLSSDYKKLWSKASLKSVPKLIKYLLKLVFLLIIVLYLLIEDINRCSIHFSQFLSTIISEGNLSLLPLDFSLISFKYLWRISPAVLIYKGNCLYQHTLTPSFIDKSINKLSRNNCDWISISEDNF